MMTDYKISYISRGGGVTQFLVRFYEGEMQVIDGEGVYVRTSKLKEETYTKDGQWSDDQVAGYLDAELAKDAARDPIPEQTI